MQQGYGILKNSNTALILQMKRYHLLFTSEAKTDIDTLYIYIVDELMSPQTADDYIHGIITSIGNLKFSAEAYAINPHEHIQYLYGPNARSITYKKMTIIYSIENDNVIIQRIIPGAVIF